MTEQNYPPDGYAIGYDESVAYGDPNASSFGITKITFDRLLKMDHADSCIALYAFFCYTARWQNTDQAKCTISYAGKALGWSDRTTQRAKAKLIEAGLIENVKRVDKITGQVTGWFIRVRHIVRLRFHPDTGDGVVHPAKSPGGGDLAPKCLRTGNRNASELVGSLPLNGETKGRKKFIPPTIPEIEIYCKEIGLDKREGKKFFDHYTSVGWKVGRNPMIIWKSALSGWMTRAEENGRNGNTNGTQPIKTEPRTWAPWLKAHPEYAEFCRGRTYMECPEYMRLECDRDNKKVKA